MLNTDEEALAETSDINADKSVANCWNSDSELNSLDDVGNVIMSDHPSDDDEGDISLSSFNFQRLI